MAGNQSRSIHEFSPPSSAFHRGGVSSWGLTQAQEWMSDKASLLGDAPALLLSIRSRPSSSCCWVPSVLVLSFLLLGASQESFSTASRSHYTLRNSNLKSYQPSPMTPSLRTCWPPEMWDIRTLYSQMQQISLFCTLALAQDAPHRAPFTLGMTSVYGLDTHSLSSLLSTLRALSSLRNKEAWLYFSDIL